MAPFYGCLTASRLQPLRGGIFFLPLSSQKFLVLIYRPQKDERLRVDLGATKWFWTQGPWIGNLAPQPPGHCSVNETSGFECISVKFNEWGCKISKEFYKKLQIFLRNVSKTFFMETLDIRIFHWYLNLDCYVLTFFPEIVYMLLWSDTMQMRY